MNINLLIGVAISDFTYGHHTLLQIIDNEVESNPESIKISNLQNKNLNEIETGSYQSTNQISVLIPDYMSRETSCGSKYSCPDKSGHIGERFLLIKVPGSSDYAVISRLS